MSRSLNPTAYAKLVASTFLFSGIPEEEIFALLGMPGVRVEHFEKDQVIFDRADTERALGIILYGACAVTKESDTGKMPMSVLRQNDLFGAASLFHDEEAYVARVMAMESTWVLLISQEALCHDETRLSRDGKLSALSHRAHPFLERKAGWILAAERGGTRPELY